METRTILEVLTHWKIHFFILFCSFIKTCKFFPLQFSFGRELAEENSAEILRRFFCEFSRKFCEKICDKKIAVKSKKKTKKLKTKPRVTCTKTGTKTNKLSIIFNFQFQKRKKVSGIWKRNFYEEKCAKFVGKSERIFRVFLFVLRENLSIFLSCAFLDDFCLGSWLACALLSHVLLNCFVILLKLW